ncbi:MAG: acyl-CoA dehydrogenase family protein [Gammaproteobacteria bacterium]
MPTVKPADKQLLAAAAAFARTTIAPAAEGWHDAGSVPRAFFERAAAAGLAGLVVPASDGGRGLGVAGFAAVLAVLARECMASTFALVVHNNLAAAIARHGSPAQRARYLEDMLEGRAVGAFLLTEPGVGSDAQAITTRAERTADGWVLNGAKAWISNAVLADVLCVYAQTEPGSGARGIACFLVDASSPGVQRLPAYALLGGQALGTGGFEFHDCRLGDEAVLHRPGVAFRAALGGIDVARLAVAAMCCGMLERALEVALDYTAARPAFGGSIGDFQGIQWKLADCATDLEAARALTARATSVADSGAPATLLAAQAKKFASEVAFRQIANCMQVMGAAGLGRNYPLVRQLAAAKIAQYLDGATEVQNVVIARALRQGRSPGS